MSEDQPSFDDPEVLPGRCQWCRGSHEGGLTVSTYSGYWWHRDCAEDNERQLSEALS